MQADDEEEEVPDLEEEEEKEVPDLDEGEAEGEAEEEAEEAAEAAEVRIGYIGVVTNHAVCTVWGALRFLKKKAWTGWQNIGTCFLAKQINFNTCFFKVCNLK